MLLGNQDVGIPLKSRKVNSDDFFVEESFSAIKEGFTLLSSPNIGKIGKVSTTLKSLSEMKII
jgi:hypothetical protein